MTSAGISYFLTRWFVNNTLSSTRCFSNTKVISNLLHTPPFWLNIVLHVPKLKITQTHIPHNYTSQINFSVQPMLWEPVEKSGYQHAHLTNWTHIQIIIVLFTLSVRVNNPWPNTFFLKVQNCHLVSLIVLVPQWMLKWSKGSALDQ